MGVIVILGIVGVVLAIIISDIIIVEHRRASNERNICETECSHGNEWGSTVKAGEGIPAQIQRRSNITFEIWMNEFHRYGRPVIVTDATQNWSIFNIATDKWLENHWGGIREHKKSLINVDAEAGKVSNKMAPNDLKYQFEQAKHKRSINKKNGKSNPIYSNSQYIGWSDDYDFENIYLYLDDLETKPFHKLYQIPYFLPQPQNPEYHNIVAYYGGPGYGLRRHQDWHSCMVAWQAQIAGIKQWYIQSPFRDIHLEDFPKEAFIDKIIPHNENDQNEQNDDDDDQNEIRNENQLRNNNIENEQINFKNDRDTSLHHHHHHQPPPPPPLFTDIYPLNASINNTLIYEFNIYPGEVLIWNVQMFHNTSSKERSLSLTGHVRCNEIRSWAKKLNLFKSIIKYQKNYFWESFWNHAKCSSNLHDLYRVCCTEWFGGRGDSGSFWGSFDW